MGIAKKLVSVGIFALLLVFLILGATSAHVFRSGSNITISQSEVIDETLFAAGQTIDISSEVNGDVFCAGQTINISGNIHGDVICAGQTLNITGSVDGDVRLAGQSVIIDGEVEGNATIASQSFNLHDSGSVGADLSTGSEDVTIDGSVGRDMAVASKKVLISGEVGRNFKGSTEQLILTSSAVINGNVEYESVNDIDKSPGALVSGTIFRTTPDSTNYKRATVFGLAVAWYIYFFIAMLLTSLVLVLAIPGVLQATTDKLIASSPWIALLVGFIASFLAPVVLIIVGLTIIGLPLMILFGLIWLVVSMLSGPFSAYYIGRLVVPKSGAILTMLVGSSLLLVLYFIPFLGFVAVIVSYWLGVGMILMELMRRTPRPVYTVVEETKPTKKVKTMN